MWNSVKISEQIKISEIFSFYELHHKSGYHFKGEIHNFWECVYVEKGSICASANERIYNLKQGEIIFHKPMEFHKLYVDSSKGATIYVLSFSLNEEAYNYFKNKVFYLSDEQKSIIKSLVSFAKSKISENNSKFSDLLIPCSLSKVYMQMAVTYIYQLLLSLISESSTSAEISTSGDAVIFKKAVNYMNSNIQLNLSISDISKKHSVSEATLKRIFNKYAGISVHKYFLQLKINAATKLLKNGSTISEVAERLGFSSQCYFSSAFKRETGQNPSEIKNKYCF